MRRLANSLSIAIVVLAARLTVAADFPKFEAVTVDPDIGKVCYAVSTADVNGDGKLDIVAVSENRVQWYENPTWAKHVILEDQTEKDNVCIAPFDIDGDGKIDFALGAGWTKIGTIQWITRQDDPAAKWKVHYIATELSTHRMRFGDVLGTGKPQLTVSPLMKSTAPGARLLAFEIPANPRTDRWKATVMDESLDRIHNHWHYNWHGQGRIDTLVAAEQGVFNVERKSDGTFQKSQLGTGAMGDKSESRGAGEIKIGRGPHDQPFLATIEPMHGTHVVIYRQNANGDRPWERIELDGTLKQGHAVWTADFDGDKVDEIVIGHREAGSGPIAGPGLYVFALDKSGKTWTKHVVDNGGVAVEDALAADFNNDGRMDIIAGGRATHNVKLYWNRDK